jgi:hypothetical protein
MTYWKLLLYCKKWTGSKPAAEVLGVKALRKKRDPCKEVVSSNVFVLPSCYTLSSVLLIHCNIDN